MAHRILEPDGNDWPRTLADDSTIDLAATDAPRRVDERSSAAAEEQADPTPAVVPDDRTSESRREPGSDAAGAGRPRDAKGRFVGNSRPADPTTELARVPVAVALEHALIDADADLFLAGQHRKLEMARTLVHAIAFGAEVERAEAAAGMYAGMLVRLPAGDGEAS